MFRLFSGAFRAFSGCFQAIFRVFFPRLDASKNSTLSWVATNGDVAAGASRLVCPPFPEIGLSQPFPLGFRGPQLKNPPDLGIRKNTRKQKNYEIPHPRVGPRNYEENTEQKREMVQNDLFCFFCISGAQPGMGIFVIYFLVFFLCFRVWKVFVELYTNLSSPFPLSAPYPLFQRALKRTRKSRKRAFSF